MLGAVQLDVCGGDTKCGRPSNPAQCARVKDYFVHKEFVEGWTYFRSLYSDIALCVLEKPIFLSITIEPLPLKFYPTNYNCEAIINPTENISITSCDVHGCGLMNKTNQPTDLLTATQVFRTQEYGDAYFGKSLEILGLGFFTVGEYFIYIESPNKPNGTICSGDSGGMIYNLMLSFE